MNCCLEVAEKHWYGAAPTTAMTHIAIEEELDGKWADWMEKVSDEQYQAKLGDVGRLGRKRSQLWLAAC
jgi:hypothetical protein